jgi:hypothetical protein
MCGPTKIGQGAVLRAFVAVAVLGTPALAQQPADTANRAMQSRGQQAMGVEQTTSSHRFASLPDGGRIVLVRDVNDSAGVARIRAHLRDLQHAFGAGDFSMPMFIHMKTVPGVSVMAARHNLITYTESDLPNGGALRIATTDSVAIAAIHQFLAFQRTEHHAGSTP